MAGKPLRNELRVPIGWKDVYDFVITQWGFWASGTRYGSHLLDKSDWDFLSQPYISFQGLRNLENYSTLKGYLQSTQIVIKIVFS